MQGLEVGDKKYTRLLDIKSPLKLMALSMLNCLTDHGIAIVKRLLLFQPNQKQIKCISSLWLYPYITLRQQTML